MSCLTADQLGEAALLAVCRFFLVDKGEAVVLECLEEVLPRNLFERVVVATPRVVDAQNARIAVATCLFDAGRPTTALLYPPADGLMVCGRLALARHVGPPLSLPDFSPAPRRPKRSRQNADPSSSRSRAGLPAGT